MELSLDFIQAIHNVVLRPDLTTASVLFVASFINELFALLPYHIILSGQLFFLEGNISVPLFAKLLVFVAVPVSFGATFGSLLTFGLTYFGGRPAIEKFGKYVRLSWVSVEKWILRLKGVWYDELLFLLIRSIPLLPSLPINVAAGIIRMSIIRYLLLTFIGTLIKVMIMFALVALGLFGLAQ